MLRTAVFDIIAAVLVPALALQIPLGSTQPWQDDHRLTISPVVLGKAVAEWNLNELPNPNATENLVFETVHSLLQQWPNTRMRNGHTIVPATIPNGTLLYHGRADNASPTAPDWTSTDPEHAYFFARNFFNSSQQGGWLLTLMTTRPLKLLYFDGSSAVKLTAGSMDSQHLIAWGRIKENVFVSEVELVEDLCKWGKSFGVDGLVRMEMDFEVVLCDFTSGVSTVSFENLFSRWGKDAVAPIMDLFETAHSGSWHYRFPGETRIQLNLAGLVSFYDTQLAPSLVPIRVGQERWDHRASNASSEDLAVIKSRIERNFIRSTGASSDIDWRTLLQVIVDRYAQRLELARYLVNSTPSDSDDILDLARKAQTQLRIMLTPYILFSATPANTLDKTDLDWSIPIFELCATTHTHAMEARFESMTDSERLILQAIRGTNREICRVVTKMWAAGVYAGIDPLLNPVNSPDVNEVGHLRDAWAGELERLMAWLDWSVWVKCDPKCSPEEMCYLPTWPINFPWGGRIPIPSPDDADELQQSKLARADFRTVVRQRLAEEVSVIRSDPEEWIRPQPKCIRRVEPYTF